MGTSVTEPLRAEHRGLSPHVAELGRPPSSWSNLDAHEATAQLGRIIGFLRDHLVPHAAAEEQVLYPVVEDAMGAPGATATMRADHAEIRARVARLADALEAVPERWPGEAFVEDLSVQLVGLAAIIELHLRKEEEVLLPVLDRTLSSGAADLLFARMARFAHGGSG
jgi:hemerythrin-like domain-containing protein